MKKKLCYNLTGILLVVCILFAMMPSAFAGDQAYTIKNVIYMIPDGGGFVPFDLANHVKNAGGMDNEEFPDAVKCTPGDMNMKQYLIGTAMTHSKSDAVTDSAASGTALSSGYKTNNGYIGVDENSVPRASLMEAAQLAGKSVGTVSTYWFSHATPAAFGGHHNSRYDYGILSEQMTNQGFDVVLGCGFGKAGWGKIDEAKNRGYTVISKKEEFQDVKPGMKLWGNATDDFPYDVERSASMPSLPDMAQAAITALSDNPNGFFLMIEGSKVDAAAHLNDSMGTVCEYLAFDDAFRVAVDFAKNRNDTIVVAVPDHDTGGMNFDPNKLDMNVENIRMALATPDGITWETTGHTARNVGIWMYAPSWVKGPEGLSGERGDTLKNRSTAIENNEVALFLEDVLGLNLQAATEQLFVDVTDQGTYNEETSLFTFKEGGRTAYANQSVGYINGEPVDLDGQVTVYSEGRFYVPQIFLEETGELGSSTNPYRISTAEEFLKFSQDILGGEDFAGKYFRQTADIDMSGTAGYTGLGVSTVFAGNYDGAGHSLKVDLKEANGNCIFGLLTGKVYNLHTAGTINAGSSYAAGIVRTVRSGGVLANCSSTMTVDGSNTAGLCYTNLGTVINCYFAGTLNGTNAKYPIGESITGANRYKNNYYMEGTYTANYGGIALNKQAMQSSLAQALNDSLGQAAMALDIDYRLLNKWEAVEGGYPVQ